LASYGASGRGDGALRRQFGDIPALTVEDPDVNGYEGGPAANRRLLPACTGVQRNQQEA
jgi:hypothetical protein